jgi:hypothetical protein
MLNYLIPNIGLEFKWQQLQEYSHVRFQPAMIN